MGLSARAMVEKHGVLLEGAGGGVGSSPGGRWWKTWHPSRNASGCSLSLRGTPLAFLPPCGNCSGFSPCLSRRGVSSLSLRESVFVSSLPGEGRVRGSKQALCDHARYRYGLCRSRRSTPTDRLWTRGGADPCASQRGFHLRYRTHFRTRGSDADPFPEARVRRAARA